MRKFLSAIMLIFTCFLANAVGGKCGDGVKWELASDGTLTITGSGEIKNMSKNSQPWRSDMIKNVVIEDGVVRIGKESFRGCKNLYAVKLPRSLKSIGEGAFADCKTLTQIELFLGLEHIENRAFENCVNITTIDFPYSLKTIGERAYAGCTGLVSVGLPETLQSLGIGTFDGCTFLASVTSLPQYLTTESSSRFGLPSKAIEAYWEQKEKETEALAQPAPVMVAAAPVQQVQQQAPTMQASSDVDLNIPEVEANRESTFAFIFANENYARISDVPFAKRDGSYFAEYCKKTLGLPEDNVRYFENATYGRMLEALYDLKQVDDAFDGNCNILFYYSGHGAPDESSREGFLIPTDAFKVSKDVCLPLSDLYAQLGGLKSKSVVVFLDACFSGSTRQNEVLQYGQRGIAMKPKANTPKGNMVVFSATSGDETAWPYQQQGHGLFTYYLLKILKEKSGAVTLGELSDYLSEMVGRTSVAKNKKKQTPNINPSQAVRDAWKDWRLAE